MSKKDRSQALIAYEFNSKIFNQRKTDGYIDATGMCQAAGKMLGHYLENKKTKSFIKTLSLAIGIPIAELIQIVMGGLGKQGTYVHPKVAIHLAQWASDDFSVFVTNLVFDWMSGKEITKTKRTKVILYPEFRQERLETIPHTKTLREAVDLKMNKSLGSDNDRKYIYTNIENWVHEAVTRMQASTHKKALNAKNGVDLLNKQELQGFTLIKETFYKELAKFEDCSLSPDTIKILCKEACNYGEKLIRLHEDSETLDRFRHLKILPKSKQKALEKELPLLMIKLQTA